MTVSQNFVTFANNAHWVLRKMVLSCPQIGFRISYTANAEHFRPVEGPRHDNTVSLFLSPLDVDVILEQMKVSMTINVSRLFLRGTPSRILLSLPEAGRCGLEISSLEKERSVFTCYWASEMSASRYPESPHSGSWSGSPKPSSRIQRGRSPL